MHEGGERSSLTERVQEIDAHRIYGDTGREGSLGAYYMKLENRMFIPLVYKLPKENTRCSSSSLRVALL